LVGRVVQAVLALELVDHAFFRLGVPPTAVYLVKPGVDRGDGGILDVLRRVEIGLADAKTDDVVALGLQLRGARGDRQGGGGLDVLDATGEFQGLGLLR
jgi:hypothetical protein